MKKLLELIKTSIEDEMRTAVRGKEYEVLMKFWIDELKLAISDFEKLKKKKPKEFLLEMNQILNTIEMFKEKLKK